MAPVEEEPRFSLHLARKEQAFLVDMVAIARHLAQELSRPDVHQRSYFQQDLIGVPQP